MEITDADKDGAVVMFFKLSLTNEHQQLLKHLITYFILNVNNIKINNYLLKQKHF